MFYFNASYTDYTLLCADKNFLLGPRGSAVEHQSLASVLSPSCSRPVADG